MVKKIEKLIELLHEELEEELEEKLYEIFKNTYEYLIGWEFELFGIYDEEEDKFTLEVFECYGNNYVRESENYIRIMSTKSLNESVTDGSWLEEEKIKELVEKYAIKREELEEEYDEEFDDKEPLEVRINDLERELEEAISNIIYTKEEIEYIFKEAFYDFGVLDGYRESVFDNLEEKLNMHKFLECYE